MEKIIVTKQNTDEVISIISNAMKDKVFKVHLGYVVDTDNAPDSFFTNIPYCDNNSAEKPVKVSVKKQERLNGILMELVTYGDNYHIRENENVIVIAKNGNVYLVSLNERVKREQNMYPAYEFKMMSA